MTKRVIHTTADFDYVENLRFTPEAVPKALETLRSGRAVIADTNMAKAGIPCIAAMGRKGGSNVAAFICSALLYTALGTLDPSRR